VHSDHRVEAQALMAELQPLVEHTQSSWIQMAMRFARAQLADDGEADTVVQEALIFSAQASGNDPQSVPGFVYIQLVPERNPGLGAPTGCASVQLGVLAAPCTPPRDEHIFLPWDGESQSWSDDATGVRHTERSLWRTATFDRVVLPMRFKKGAFHDPGLAHCCARAWRLY